MRKPILMLVLVCMSHQLVHADLIDRGGGLIYDTDFNITWLADARYAQTAGLMSWSNAMTWVDQLEYAGYDDWRLPTARNAAGALPTNGPGNAINHNGSELGHLFYDELGGIANESIFMSVDSDLSLFSNIDGWLAADKRSGAPGYWTSDRCQLSGYTNRCWYFAFSNGTQWAQYDSVPFNAWAVRDGDVVSTPVPTAAILGFLGLGTAAAKFRRRRDLKS